SVAAGRTRLNTIIHLSISPEWLVAESYSRSAEPNLSHRTTIMHIHTCAVKPTGKVAYVSSARAFQPMTKCRPPLSRATCKRPLFTYPPSPNSATWDALVSAFAARKWDTGRWPNDLHRLPCDGGERLILPQELESHYAWPEAVPPLPPAQELTTAPTAPKQGGASAWRGGDRWKIAVERLERAGHDDVAQQIVEYRNARRVSRRSLSLQ